MGLFERLWKNVVFFYKAENDAAGHERWPRILVPYFCCGNHFTKYLTTTKSWHQSKVPTSWLFITSRHGFYEWDHVCHLPTPFRTWNAILFIFVLFLSSSFFFCSYILLLLINQIKSTITLFPGLLQLSSNDETDEHIRVTGGIKTHSETSKDTREKSLNYE